MGCWRLSTTGTRGAVMPKSAKLKLVEAFPTNSCPATTWAFTSQVAGRVTPCTVKSPTSWKVTSPEAGSGDGSPSASAGTNSAVGNRLVFSGFRWGEVFFSFFFLFFLDPSGRPLFPPACLYVPVRRPHPQKIGSPGTLRRPGRVCPFGSRCYDPMPRTKLKVARLPSAASCTSISNSGRKMRSVLFCGSPGK